MPSTAARETISETYRTMQQSLHENPNYGTTSLHYGEIVKELMDLIGATSLSDYGAGKQNLRKALANVDKTDFDYRPFDPAFPEYGPPRPGDLVCCIDVLEHIEPEYLDSVLLDLRDITTKVGLFSVHTGAARKHLADGRNAHLIQQKSSWWLPKLCQFFEIRQLTSIENGFFVVVQPRIAPAA